MSRILLIVFLVVFLILTTMKNWRLAVGLFIVFLGGVLFMFYGRMETIEDKQKTAAEIETVRILYAADHKDLMNDSELRELFKRKTGLTPAGDMFRFLDLSQPSGKNFEGWDAVWPSGQCETDLLNRKFPDRKWKGTPLFRSPLLLCTWRELVPVLTEKEIIRKTETGFQLEHPGKLIDLIQNGHSWASLGARQLEGPVRIAAALPGKSETGLLSALWLAGIIGNRETFHLPDDVKVIYDLMENPADTPDGLFNTFIKQGVWTYPLILADESRAVAFYQALPAYREKMEKEVVWISPAPGLDRVIPFIPLTEKGERFQQSLNDPEIQERITARYGLRSENRSEEKLPDVFEKLRLPPAAPSGPLPSPDTAEAVLSAFP